VTRYELLDRIGVGGMAEIFRGKAVAAGGFEKPVAIKRILPHLSSDRRFVELLIAEAKVLSLLKHRNIVQIFDVGLGDDGQYFLVMEFVDGQDLGAIERVLEHQRRRIPFDLVLHVGAEMCEALEHAHTAKAPDGKQMQLVHRDVSPSNVLLSRAGEVKLSDFGIAKRAESDPTNSGAVRGKFAYISPEQARNEHLDPRSDVFSVGILLWELLCNRRLFSQLDDMGALRGVREGPIPRPTEIDPQLPAEIDNLLMPALARDKTRRYASAGQFGMKLRSLRYSLETTVGDPASELAKIVDSTEQVERASKREVVARPKPRIDFDASEGTEATVIRIRTADAFSARDNDASISMARAVIDRFEEEEETRLAQLSSEQMRELRGQRRDSAEVIAAPSRARRPSEEATRASEPLDALLAALPRAVTPDEATRLIAPFDRRTPPPQRMPPASMPPMSSELASAPRPTSGLRPRPPTPPPLPTASKAPIAARMPSREATPTSQDRLDRSLPAVRSSVPQVAGFAPRKKSSAQSWLLVVGAIVVAAAAFAITRMFMH
jgi:eukaryotic-like serine/threonine-protein kinase